ncbi:HesA/MoeB/ThiF family protein [Vannielia litorea]|uniref:Molybdopterin-synthase adenylyltransferase n=1 Tax=Vannielia litorea TaxID=1217970 RepID=A0A1N6ID96_9RHOB|nr:molybdopterin-synthase adenylyltransferase MoeB [Vannielia litorea]SIO29983.1 Molybdopterin or thiamine biosynthesis adenylyltransferase [Vannielia litorea]
MLLVFALMALAWWGGAALGAPRRQRKLAVVAIVGAALVLNLALPEGHALRAMTGGQWELWFIVLLFGGIALGYGLLLKLLRREAAGIEQAEARRDAGHAAPTPEDPAKLTPDELTRYARHIVLREIGGPGQKRLKAARVLVIGAGGLGSPALLYLAAAGVGHVTVLDDDTVDASNLQRQVIHRTDGQGRNKAESAAEAMAALNPHVKVTALAERLTLENGPALVAQADMILDGTDNSATRYLANDLAVAAGIPLVSGALSQWEGQISVFDPAQGAPCYRCIFPEAPAPGLAPSCAEAGVMGPLPGVVGAMMAAEAVKLVTGAGSPLRGEMLIYDALWGETRKIRLKRRLDCPTCGQIATTGE